MRPLGVTQPGVRCSEREIGSQNAKRPLWWRRRSRDLEVIKNERLIAVPGPGDSLGGGGGRSRGTSNRFASRRVKRPCFCLPIKEREGWGSARGLTGKSLQDRRGRRRITVTFKIEYKGWEWGAQKRRVNSYTQVRPLVSAQIPARQTLWHKSFPKK